MKKIIYIVMVLSLFVISCEKTTKPMETVTTPNISPIEGTYYTAQSIQMSCATNGATIRYTLDGSTPNNNSAVFSSPIEIHSNTTVKAQAFKDKMKSSAIASATYNFDTGSLYMNPEGGNYSTPQTVEISGSSPNTVIHYTLDGSDPTESSQIYAAPIVIDGNVTIKARGFVSGWTPSIIKSATFSFTAPAPTFSIDEGLYYQSFDLSLNSALTGASIHYTMDGTEPTENSTLFTTSILVDKSQTIKAKAFKNNWNSSTIASADYELKVVALGFNPAPGQYTVAKTVKISTSTPNVKIFYTTDGTNPSQSSTAYTAPVLIPLSSTLKAVAYKTGWTPSNITSGAYTYTTQAPVFDPPAGTYTEAQMVSITSPTPDAVIRYTTDGNDPTSTSTVYSTPINISTTTTLKAKAYRTGWTNSTVTSGNYYINPTQQLATPTFNPQGGTYNSIQNVTITCSSSGATIRYTTDNSEPTTTSTIYTIPITIATDTTIKAKAFRTGWFDSLVGSETYTINFNSTQMINIPSGTFTMGRTIGTGEADELPPHTVTLSSFAIGKYEVMQSDWAAVMGANPSYFSSNTYRPVENVNWYDVIVYCNKRSINEGLTPVYSLNGSSNPTNWGAIPSSNDATWNTMVCDLTAHGYRLPTEAEWEYVARGATNTPDYVYSGSNTLADVAWIQSNSAGSTHPIGQLLGNGLSVFDMCGNVNEWCWDWYESNYFTVSPVNNPSGPATGSYRLIRGGSWDNFVANNCRVSKRASVNASNRVNNIGFRVARTLN